MLVIIIFINIIPIILRAILIISYQVRLQLVCKFNQTNLDAKLAKSIAYFTCSSEIFTLLLPSIIANNQSLPIHQLAQNS